MTQELFWGLSPSAWVAIATFFYAVATAGIAYVTLKASQWSIQASNKNTALQIESSNASIIKQVEASKEAALIQARASSVSNNRQKWINELREEIVAFLTSIEKRRVIESNSLHHQSFELNEQKKSVINSMQRHIFKVRLLLNPNEGESTELIELLEKALFKSPTSMEQEYIVKLTQSILKIEWERVKSGV